MLQSGRYMQLRVRKYNYVPVPFRSTRRSTRRKLNEGFSMVNLRRRISPNEEVLLRVVYQTRIFCAHKSDSVIACPMVEVYYSSPVVTIKMMNPFI